jgi:hypothetical protein
VAFSSTPASVVSQKFIEEQPQILRLILAQNAPKFAQDDNLFAMQTLDSPHWQQSLAGGPGGENAT